MTQEQVNLLMDNGEKKMESIKIGKLERLSKGESLQMGNIRFVRTNNWDYTVHVEQFIENYWWKVGKFTL